ncbi:hypothetical protein [Shewanella baltica]|uniref:hypothetical protein n=1 Tax=Shewanella baltica TaxID=62322 RepID=UPI00217DD845|nr:hypothetical protein [Shewanella baltica]MCS6102335.1 hypothetical protein [Shewanella baltica]MCS6185531.1 hypothetical protein [Shewanella baltica]
MDKWSPKYIGNSARKREAAAEHNARYEQRDAVRPNIAKIDRFKGVNIGAVGKVDSGLKRETVEANNVIFTVDGKPIKALAGTVSLTWEDGQFKKIKPQKKPSLFQRFARFASYLQNKLIGR